MNWTIDIILILTAVITVVVYTCRGFVKSLFGLCKYILSFILSLLFAPMLGALISERLLLSKINGSISNFISDIVDKVGTAINAEGLIKELPSAISNMLVKTDVYGEIIAKYGDSPLNEELINDISLSISTPISGFISNVIAYILIFVVSLIVLSILAILLNKVCDLPVLKKMNRILGCVLGMGCAFINLIILCALISLVINIIGISNSDVSVAIMSEKTIVYGFINKIDIVSFFMSIIKRV